jgi:long-chain acyl-CoA synthetase
MNENLATKLTRAAAKHATRPALKLDETTLTYAELDATSARVAGMLRARGIEPGDRVGLLLPNVPEFAVAFFGALRAGAVVVPMNILLKPREVENHVSDSGAKLVLSERYEIIAADPAEPLTEVVPRAGVGARPNVGPPHVGARAVAGRPPAPETGLDRCTKERP